MNKLFTKIAKAFVGLSMAIGVGVAVASNSREATPVEATTANATAATSITSGKKYLVTAVYSNKTYYLTPGSTALGTGQVVATEISDITKATESMCWTFTGSGTSWTIAANGFYLANTNTNNGVKTQASSQSWTSSFSSSTLTLTGGNSRKLALYQSSNWRCYSSSSGVQSLKIYEYAAPATYTVSFAVSTAGYGTVSSPSITNVPSGSGITVSGNKVTINGSSVTATASANTAQYTYAFTGWSNTSGTITATRTITANFTRTTNTFTVDDSGITGGSLDSTAAIEYGGDLDVNIVPDTNYSVPTSVSVTMGGTDISGDVQYEDGYLYYTPVTGNIVVTAACIPQGTTYTVTYNANSGTVTPASEEVIENGHPSFPTPTRSGYNFKGWQVNGSGTAYTDPEDYTVTGDVTFVASWAAVYSVTFNANGGSSSPASQSVESGSTFTFPSAGTKTHYSFDGWTSTGDEPYYAVGATSPAVTGNITYTAHWTEDAKYTVTYSAASPASGSYAHNNNYGGTYTLLPFASLSGITYDSDVYQFKNYTVGGVNKNPGDTFTLSAATTVTVNFEEKPLVYQITFGTAEGTSGITSFSNTAYVIPSGVTLNNIQGNVYSNTSNQAASLRFGKSGTTGSFDATITGNYYIVSVTCNLKYYGSDSTATFAVTPNGGSAISKSLTGSWADYTYDVSSAKATKVTLGTDVNGKRAYLSGFTITYAALPELDSVTTSGQKATFSAGEKFSYGGTLTAHYTRGKADATVTPASYKVGASGINPTSAGTAITTATTMTIGDHNGKYIYVVYTEDNITKWASYQITVNPAAPTGIVLSSSSITVGIDETFSFTDVEVTINPSAYATQDAYEWVMVDDLGLDVEFDYPDIVVHEDSNGEPLIIRCRSTVDNSVYADFELTVSGNPIAVLYDANDQDVTSGTASYFADYGNDIYYHVSATNFGTNVTYTWSSSNSSILSVDDDDSTSCGYYIEDGADGTARLSCVISGSKGSATVYIDVTITPVSVTSVTWNAPSIDVYSGASMSTASWNVRYSTNSGKTDQVPDSYKIFLGDTEIASNHTWTADDDGETLKVKVGNVYSSSTTVKVTQTIHSVVASIPGTPISEYQLVESQSDLEEGRYLIVSIEDAKAFDGSLDTLDAGRNNFDVTISGGTVIANDSTASGKYFDLTVENDAWTITSASGANVGHSATGNGMNGTGTNTITVSDGISTILGTGGKGLAYNSASGATSERFRYYTSPAANANHSVSLFKLVEQPGTPTSAEIANVAAHKEAQRVAVKFAKAFNAAMDLTENCTTGLDAAWATCTSAYETFQTEAAALGSEKAYAEYYIKYASCEWSDDSGEACIERMLRTYKACVQVHGKTAFMSDLVTLGAPQVSPLVNIIGENTNTVAIIVIISMVSVTAIGGYFFLRKKKAVGFTESTAC